MKSIRRIVTTVEETFMEQGRRLAQPIKKASAVAVIHNPYNSKFSLDLDELIVAGEYLGELLPQKAVEALGGEAQNMESFGKAAIVGENGELEHAAAIIHPKLGAPFRRVLGGGEALIPSAKKSAGPGASIDVPLGHKDHPRVRSHFDALEVRVPDSPKCDEIVVAIAISDNGRPFPRVGGLTKDEIKNK